jgi:serine/threonine-protein kinase
MSPLAVEGAVIGGRYRLETIIGKGGMGAVWSATHLGLHRRVAVKIISHDLARAPDLRKRFDTEAKAAARLQSRHVVQIYDNGELDDGTPFIAMELLEGESLQAKLASTGPLPIAEAVNILAQAARALGRAHAVGIIHRDIKPDNIFLARSEEDGGIVVKVLDFGVAKFTVVDEAQSTTRTGSLVGTPLYMSPEQARGLKTLDARTDLYSLGLVAFTMLTNGLAFSAESFGDLLLQICTRSLPSLCAHRPDLPPTMDAWFHKACAREAADRFATAQELIDALTYAAGGSGTPVHLSAPSFPNAPPVLAITRPSATPVITPVQRISAPEAMALASSPTIDVRTPSPLLSHPHLQSLGGSSTTTQPEPHASGAWKKTAALVVVAAAVAAVVGGGIVVLVNGHQAPAQTANASPSTPAIPASAAPSTPATTPPSVATSATATTAPALTASAPSASASARIGHAPIAPRPTTSAATTTTTAPLDIKLTR